MYLLSLVGPLDDLPIRFFQSREALRDYFATGPLAQDVVAAKTVVRRDGPSDPFGYAVFVFDAGRPVRYVPLWDEYGPDLSALDSPQDWSEPGISKS